MRTFKISFNISEAMLADVVSLLSRDARIRSLNVTEDERDMPPSKPREGRAPRNNSAGAGNIIMTYMKAHRQATMAQLASLMEPEGYSPSTASPTTSKLVQDGHLVRSGHTGAYLYTLPDAPKTN